MSKQAIFHVEKPYSKILLSQEDKDEVKGYLLKYPKGAIWSNISEEICRDMKVMPGFEKYVYFESGVLKPIPEFKKFVIQRLQNLRHGRASLLAKRGRPKADIDDTKIEESSFDFDKALAKGDKEEEKCKHLKAFRRRRTIGLTQQALEDLQIDHNAIDSDDTTKAVWNKNIKMLENVRIKTQVLDNETLVAHLKKREIKLALVQSRFAAKEKKIKELEQKLKEKELQAQDFDKKLSYETKLKEHFIQKFRHTKNELKELKE